MTILITQSFEYSRGPKIELYHAEEAIGLVKSLNWGVIAGPKSEQDEEEEGGNESGDEQLKNELKIDD